MDAPRVSRIDSVGEAGVTIRVTVRTRPNARDEVSSALRWRLAQEFLAEKIQVPYPVLHENPQPRD